LRLWSVVPTPLAPRLERHGPIDRGDDAWPSGAIVLKCSSSMSSLRFGPLQPEAVEGVGIGRAAVPRRTRVRLDNERELHLQEYKFTAVSRRGSLRSLLIAARQTERPRFSDRRLQSPVRGFCPVVFPMLYRRQFEFR